MMDNNMLEAKKSHLSKLDKYTVEKALYIDSFCQRSADTTTTLYYGVME